MKNYYYLALALLLLVITPVAADTDFNLNTYDQTNTGETIVDESLSTYIDTSNRTTTDFPKYQSHSTHIMNYNSLYFPEIENHLELYYVVFDIPAATGTTNLAEGRNDITYTQNGQTKPGVIYVVVSRNILGQVTHTQLTIFLNEWDIAGAVGPAHIVTNVSFLTGDKAWSLNTQVTPPPPCMISGPGPFGGQGFVPHGIQTVTVSSGIPWKNHLTISTSDHNTGLGGELTTTLHREIEGRKYISTLNVTGIDDEVIYTNYNNVDIDYKIPKKYVKCIEVVALGGQTFTFPIDSADPDPDDPDTPNVIVYVKNSQTGALIANANIVIDALVNGEYYTVVNRPEPSGIFSITLQPTGGGQPNPDGYRLIVTADGYNNPMPEINFTVDDYKLSIYCLLDPIAGGPVNENKTFIDFFVRDMASNPISGATVKFGKYTLITNSAGYTVFEVDKNNHYTWTVSKSGYGSLTGNAVIGDAPRHTINTVLAPIVTPTTTTPIPTSPPIGPTPTMTAPTGESVSNWLEWFAAHFGMILGGGVEIGKIFMWLCFTVPVGVYVGKEAKAGAAGFMAGAGIVTLFFVLIGWVPIWLVVLLALLIGLLYAKVFNTPDNGGGR